MKYECDLNRKYKGPSKGQLRRPTVTIMYNNCKIGSDIRDHSQFHIIIPPIPGVTRYVRIFSIGKIRRQSFFFSPKTRRTSTNVVVREHVAGSTGGRIKAMANLYNENSKYISNGVCVRYCS